MFAGLQLTKRLFDVDITAADGEAAVWHKDVRFFKVSQNGQPKAYFYLGVSFHGNCLRLIAQTEFIAGTLCGMQPLRGMVQHRI